MFKVAFRNVLRNGRRSLMTAGAIAIGASALILLGEYNGLVKLGIETGVIRSAGHLAVFKRGYMDFGSGRPAQYSISGYEKVVDLIRNDPTMKPMLVVVTPRVSLGGIAGNAMLDKSKTFFGSGFIPSDQKKMNEWNGYRLSAGRRTPRDPGALLMSDSEVDHGIVGQGFARIIGICRQMKLADCPATTEPKDKFIADEPSRAGERSPRLDLLSGSSGAPNIAAFYANEARGQGAKELDDMYVGMHLKLAQQLLYGIGERKVTSIALQLGYTQDVPAARARLNALFGAHKLALEVRDFNELFPNIGQVIGYFQTMFAFIALVMGMIVVFTVANTMGMSVMERTNEIGTARAMGVQRGGIRRQFLLEGVILGAFGATAGLALSAVLTYWINNAGITYTPPGNAQPVPLLLLTDGTGTLLAGVWLALVVISTIASIVPANRAARMQVIDALRHV